MESLFSKKKSFALILVWIFLTSTAPFIFFRWPGHPYKLLTLICLLVMLLQMAIFNKKIKYDFAIFLILLVQILYYLILFICYNNFSSLNLIMQLVSLYILINYMRCFVGFKLVAKSFVFIMLGMAIGGTLIFFLHILVGLEPIFLVPYGGDISYFFGFTTSNVFVNLNGVRFIRYSGFFDEPGAFALFASFALVVNKIYFNNKKYELLLILLTFFTFSMAFYFTMLIYILLYYFNRHTIKYTFVLIGIISISFFIIHKIDLEIYDKITSMTIDRFTETQMDISSTNRGDLMELDYKTFIENPVFGVGLDDNVIAGSNVYAILAKYGIVGSFFFYIFLFYMFFLVMKMRFTRSIKYLKVLIILLVSLFHRPELSSVLTLSIFYMIIYHMRLNNHAFEINPTNNISIS
jgi:hypothetical protein